MVLAADVYKAGVLAGRLSLEADGATKFVYIDGYAGPAVASTLPVSDMPVVNFNGALPNFFTGLLPEGLLGCVNPIVLSSWESVSVPLDILTYQGERPVFQGKIRFLRSKNR